VFLKNWVDYGMRDYRLIHLLPLIYYVATRRDVTLQELSILLGISRSIVRRLVWAARRAGLVDYRRADENLFIEPTGKALQLMDAIEFFARRRNKAVIIIGGGIIYAVVKPRKGIRAYPIPLDKLCTVLANKQQSLDTGAKTVTKNPDLHPKTVSLLERVLKTMGCPSSYCILNNLCRRVEDKE